MIVDVFPRLKKSTMGLTDYGEGEYVMPDAVYDYLREIGYAPRVKRIGDAVGPFLIYGIGIHWVDIRVHPSYWGRERDYKWNVFRPLKLTKQEGDTR